MLDWKRLSTRYGRMTYQQRMGNLASTLARTAAVAQNKSSMVSVPDLLREGRWIIEWSAPDVPPDALAELASMQKELGLLHRAWETDADALRAVVAFRARAMSEHVLELSGLLSLPR
jgi:hypothetical protein